MVWRLHSNVDSFPTFLTVSKFFFIIVFSQYQIVTLWSLIAGQHNPGYGQSFLPHNCGAINLEKLLVMNHLRAGCGMEKRQTPFPLSFLRLKHTTLYFILNQNRFFYTFRFYILYFLWYNHPCNMIETHPWTFKLFYLYTDLIVAFSKSILEPIVYDYF